MPAIKDDQSNLLFEVTPIMGTEIQEQYRPDGQLHTGNVLGKLEQLGDTIGQTCQTLVARTRDKLREFAPDVITLEFGLVLAGEAGFPMLTKASAQASIVVKATWKNPSVTLEPKE